MEILTVSNDKALLADLHGALRSLFPTAYIAQETDPLMAGKYAFQNDVDMLLADVDMKRMDGIQLVHFVRQERPHVQAYLMGAERVLCGLPLTVPDDVLGWIICPFTAASLAAVLCKEADPEYHPI